MFQPIETTTANGVPDIYFSCQLGKNKFNCWLETKTQDYKVSNDQINWEHAHSLAGGKTWVVTEFDKKIVFLKYDDKMSDCSTLGVYIRRHKPTLLSIVEWMGVENLSPGH